MSVDARCVSFIQCGPQRSVATLSNRPRRLTARKSGADHSTATQRRMTESTNAEIIGSHLERGACAHATSTQVLQAEVQMLKSQLSSVVPAAAHKQSKRQSRREINSSGIHSCSSTKLGIQCMLSRSPRSWLRAFSGSARMRSSGFWNAGRVERGQPSSFAPTRLRHNHLDSEAEKNRSLTTPSLAGKLNARRSGWHPWS